jgi:hypothetical protein
MADVSRSGVRPTLTPRRHRREVENSEFAAMFRRLMRAYVRRVGDQGDLDAFAEFARLIEEGEGHLVDMAAMLRHEPWSYSWAEVGRALVISRQSAQERFRKAGGSRRAGGQPGHLR